MKDSTKALHVGYNKGDFGTMSVPIYQTTAYDFQTAQTAADRFALKNIGPIYTRLTNPTTDIFEARLAALESGSAALATASGQSAIFFAISNLASCNDNILVGRKVYGGTSNLVSNTIKSLGIKARVFDSENADDLEGLIDENTKAIIFESLSNPQISIANVEQIVKIAQKYGIVTICDNTVATPILFKPITFGVDVVVHSTSKYISGQGSSLGGALIERDGLNEKLKNNPRYPLFNNPEPSYHGLVFSSLELPIFTLRARIILLRDLGASLSPFNAWLNIQGLETLSLRIEKHSQNADKIAQFLSTHKRVKSVFYPTLKSHPQNKRVKEYFLNSQCSGLLSFDVGDEEFAKKIQDDTKLFSVVVNIGDTKSIITHPASTTHQQSSQEELEKSGITKGLIRLSVGLEDVDDLIDDLKSVLD